MPIRVISRGDVQSALPMPQCIDRMADAMSATSRGEVVMPGRQLIPLSGRSGFLGMMPGSCANPRSDGVKLLSIKPDNSQIDLPVLQGAIILFDPESGSPAALIDAIEVTAIRTAAVSGLATKLLARPEAKTVAIFGCGVQAASHIDAMQAVIPVERFVIWGRSPENTEAFCEATAARISCPVDFIASGERAAGMADIICTVTAAAEPILKGDWVTAGTHINLVGSHDAQHRECDSDLIARAAVFSDHTPFALKEAGEIVAAIESGAITEQHIISELGQLVNDSKPGRKSDDQITVFKSLGLVSQDLLAADLVLRNASAHDLGTLCEF